MNTSTKDDIYAYALSKTLTKVSSPATVGLYSSCSNRSHMILRQMEGYMDQEALRIERECKEGPRPRSSTSFTGFLGLVTQLLFYRPVWTKQNQRHRNVRFFYVNFSAWHFAGSDLLWAGLAIRLFQAMQMHFGKLQLALYRVAQHDEEEEVKKKIIEDGPNYWRSKKICCCPLWFLVLSILVVPIVMVTVLLTRGLPKPAVKPGEGVNTTTSGHLGILEGLLIASLGVPAASALRCAILMGKDLIFSQEFHLKRGMDNQKISGRLGFMNEVRKEIWLLSRFIQFMEVFERRRIRAVLQITNLDRCSPKKIVAVLDAINILLSDEESPFISILAVNPQVLVEKVNFADGCFSKEDRAYALLNRIVTLAFTVPPLSDDSKHCLFYDLTNSSKVPGGFSEIEREPRRERSSSDVPLVEVRLTTETNALIKNSKVVLDVNEEEVENLIWSILSSSERKLNQYMLDDAMSMRRVINSIRVTVIIMKALEKEIPLPEQIAAWVILANQWPCRLSWIIQCVEDAQQRAEIDGKTTTDHPQHSKTLWRVFSESRAELYVMSAQIEDLLEQDGDPETFERLLRVDYEFTVKDLEAFEVATVNLDHSIRKELAQIRGTSKLKNSGWMRDLAPLPITRIINMETEDVCKELERMEYPNKYVDIVKNNNLDGVALVFGDSNDLKALLDMNYGEWATFRLHFLSFRSHLRPQRRSGMPSASHLKNQLSSFLLHAPHHSSSNLSPANS